MKRIWILLLLLGLEMEVLAQKAQVGQTQRESEPGKSETTAGNPVFPGWYADPEGIIYGDQYWIYPTYSAPYEEQVFMDAFSSPDLVNWTKHPRIIDTASIKWAWRAMWAPAVIEKEGKYYLFFGANDIQSNEEGIIELRILRYIEEYAAVSSL